MFYSINNCYKDTLALAADVDADTQIVQISIGTQSDHVETADGSTQCETIASLDHETQYDLMGIDHSTQSIMAETIECGVQSEVPVTIDVDVQVSAEVAETKDADVQVAVAETKDIGVQYETSDAIVSVIDTDEEFFDATSKPSSKSTIKNATVFANIKPTSDRSVISTNYDGQEDAVVISKETPVTAVDTIEVIRKDTGSIVVDDKDTTTAVDTITKETGSIVAMIGEKDTTTVIEEAICKDTGSIVVDDKDTTTAVDTITKETGSIVAMIGEKDTTTVIEEAICKDVDSVIVDDKDTTNETSRQVDPVTAGIHSEDEKLFTKSETDALIASAVALALANAAAAAASNKEQAHEEPMDDPKRHTCDMSLNDHIKRAADSAVASQSSASLDDDMTETDYGNVVVHVPTEEDTITSSPYQEKRQREREVAHPDQYYKKARILADGPTTVFDQAPADDSGYFQRELTEADVPVRPANPPPTALLHKAGRSAAFTDSRSMSPISARSKGKQPYDPYSDLESQPSHENMHHQPLDKRRSISMSSLSTNNTNEQLQSITSSQYDTSGARSNSGATTMDPNTINLITKTMIGDWLWKYTRKAVGGGMSERRHQRYFWIHPYTRTLYWSTAAPGLDTSQAKAKSGNYMIDFD
jgi:hypothetical protein